MFSSWTLGGVITLQQVNTCFFFVPLIHSLRGAVLVPDLPGWTLWWPSEAQWGREKKVGFPFYFILLSLLRHKSKSLPVLTHLVGHLSSYLLFVQTSWKKSCYWLHLWRRDCGWTRDSVRQRWRQFREQWIWRGWGHPRYWWVNVCWNNVITRKMLSCVVWTFVMYFAPCGYGWSWPRTFLCRTVDVWFHAQMWRLMWMSWTKSRS